MLELVSLNAVSPIEREIVGVLKEIKGFNNFKVNAKNISGDKSVFVDVDLKDGKVERFFCSKAVSSAIRNKEIQITQVPSLPIAIATREDGSKFYQIQMPDGVATTVTITAEQLAKAVPFVKSNASIDFESLIAL